MQITREDLQNMYQKSLKEKRDERVAVHLDSFDRMIHSVNSKGQTIWKPVYFKEDPTVLDGVVVKLREKYIDSKITITYKCDNPDHSSIAVDWSI